MAEKTEIINVTIDSNKAVDNIQKLNELILQSKIRLTELEKQGKKNTEEYIQLQATISVATKELNLNKKAIESQTKAQNDNIKSLQGAKPLRQQLRELTMQMQDMALAGKDGSEEFLNLAKQAGKLKDAIAATADQTKTFAVGSKFELGLKTSKEAFDGLAGAAQVYEGAAALVGAENENITKSIQKMVALQSLMNGVQTVFNALSKEGAVVTALITAKNWLLTASQNAYTFAVELASKSLGKLKLAMLGTGFGALIVGVGMLISKFSSLNNEVEDNSKKLEENRKKQELIQKQITNKLNEQEDIRKTKVEKNIKILEEKGKQDLAFQARLKELDYQISLQYFDKAKQEELKAERELLIQKEKNRIEELRKKKEQQDAENKINDEKIRLAGIIAQLEANVLNAKDHTIEKLNAELALINEQEKQKLSEAKTEGDINLIKAQASKERSDIAYREASYAIELSNQEYAAKKENEEKKTQKLKEEAEKQKEIERIRYEATISTASNALNALAGLWDESSGEYKALATAQAIIDTYSSANAAYKSVVGIPVVGTVLAPIAAGTAILNGLQNVRKINAVQKGSTTVSGSSSVPKNYSMNTNQSIAVGKYGTIPQSSKTQVAVVVDDVTAKQNSQNAIKKASTI